MYGTRRISRMSTISATEYLSLCAPGDVAPYSWSQRPRRACSHGERGRWSLADSAHPRRRPRALRRRPSHGSLDTPVAGDERRLHAAWRGRLRRAAAFGPGNQPADPFLDPDLRLPPQQLLGLGGTIPQRGLGGGSHRARRLLVEGLEGRARQPQQDLGDLVERRVDPSGNHEALARDLTGHRHDRGARDVADINIVVPF